MPKIIQPGIEGLKFKQENILVPLPSLQIHSRKSERTWSTYPKIV